MMKDIFLFVLKKSNFCFNVFIINSFKSCNFIFTSASFSRRRGAALVCVFEDLRRLRSEKKIQNLEAKKSALL